MGLRQLAPAFTETHFDIAREVIADELISTPIVSYNDKSNLSLPQQSNKFVRIRVRHEFRNRVCVHLKCSSNHAYSSAMTSLGLKKVQITSYIKKTCIKINEQKVASKDIRGYPVL